MKVNKLMIFMAGLFILSIWGLNAYALKAPHNNSKNVVCSNCHKSPRNAPGFLAVTSFENMCLNAQSGCHVSNPGAKPDASKKKLTRTDASNRFKNIARDSYYVTYSTNKKQSSHGWKIPNTNSDAGATNNWAPMREYGDSIYLKLKTRIYCTRCHRAHGDAGPGGEALYKSFLKADPTGDYLCFQCHASRRIGDATNTNVRGPLPSSIGFAGSMGETITVAPHYSHPVEVNYSSARAKAGKSSLFFKNPTSSFPTNASANLKLYTTKGGVKGAVVCSTCHGPLHSADSNPYTFDSLSTYSRTNNYSTSAGNLLRRYPMSKSDDICVSCHKVTTHRTFKCNRCHTPHKKAGENNRYLILENISTPYSGRKDVQFISTSAMAFRYTNSVPGKSAICQVCHTGTEIPTLKYHRNYSSNTLADRTHNYDGGSGKYLYCPQCHEHSIGFVPGGPAACGSCHKAPPIDTFGKHGKHVGSGSNSGSYKWDTAELQDKRSGSVYGFSCGRCHSKWAPYTSSVNYPRHRPAAGYDDKTYGRYTAEVGFMVLSTLTKDPASSRQPLLNPAGTYNYGTRGARMDFGNESTVGTSGSWFSWPASGQGTCNNIYCHGQFFNGYTSNNPTWLGTQTCGNCHGVAQELGMGIPGRTGSVSYGAHQRHVGAGTQEYGQLSPRFRCNACHNATSGMNNATTLNKNNHVNGRTNVKFDAAYGDSASTYGGLNNYSGKTNRNAASPKTVYKTCSQIYCHSDGSRQGNYSAGNQALAFKYPNWSSTRNFTTTQSSTKRRCSRCHGADRTPGTAFTGITAFMPGYSSRTGKGNSHYKHVVENGFLCTVCHSRTLNTDNKSIMFTYSAHINKRYDVDIKSTYGGTYDSATHKCSNVECHGLKTTPAWGNPANCQDCHISNTSDADKRILPRSKFTGWTSSAPKIYSTQWTQRGHGRQFGNYTRSGNAAANQACGACHKASVSHGTGSNPFRLITAPDRPNVVCNKCHGVGATGAVKKDILTHASSVTGGGHNYEIKCIDCHDPHGDNNIFMLHSTLPRPGAMAKDVASGKYGIITSVSVVSNVDFVNNVYTSDYALKSSAPKVCQVCHDETYKPSSTAGVRYRYGGSSDTKHGSDKCTKCHQHTKGFKGAGCTSCHGNPPAGTWSILGGPTTTNVKTASGAPNAGAHVKHISIYGSNSSTCAKCHQGGMYESGSESATLDLGFKAFNSYTGNAQKYTGYSTVRKNGIYAYAGAGYVTGDTSKCQSMKCHGGGNWLTASYGTPTAPVWYNAATARCGKCHGAKKAAGQGSWPTSNAHARHAGTVTQYDFMCKLCHNTTVLGSNTTLDKDVHVNGLANFGFYTGAGSGSRVWSGSSYNGDTVVNSGFGVCQNTYCHSRGTKTMSPYTGIALPNYTAKWAEAPANRCNYCHGNKSFNGITAAMPAQSGQAHAKHAHNTNGDNFRCSFCHANVVNSSGQIISYTNHVNKFKNISVISTYKTANEAYDPSGAKTCSSIKCHGGRTTPAWNSTATCTNCHYSTASPEDSFTWQNYSGTVARIYSTEWTKRGHGKTKVSGKYPFSNNTGAGKTCTICHTASVKHNQANYFRLRTTVTSGDSDKLCAACHGSGTELGKMGAGTFGKMTGIQTHSWANMSTNGYTGANNTGGKAGWNFPNQTVKCVDCHDPHGDKNNYMVHSYINMTGSDSVGRPVSPNNQDTVLMNFTAAKGGTLMTWSSFANSGNSGLCQRCHSAQASMGNFARDKYNSTHQQGNRCTNCHKHKKGFTPSGCDACHGYPPGYNGKAGPSGWKDSLTNKSSLHQPHAWNVRSRPGIPTNENNQQSNLVPAGQQGYYCNRCHGGTEGDSVSNGQDASHGSNIDAGMKNMTMVWGDWSKGAFSGRTSVTDDTCKNVKCHTPRYYTRGWKKPVDCDDCHGYVRTTGANRAFQLQTTGSHKTHINWTGTANPPTSWKKNYRFACSRCHYDPINNYSTHYSGMVNFTAQGSPNNGGTYSRGKSFKGFTTGSEHNNTSCTKVYCHGNFNNGTTAVTPSWKRGQSTVKCGSCHKAKTAQFAAWQNGTTMPARHPKHVRTATYNFGCSKCHVRTAANNTTVQFNWSSHANTRVDVYFDNVSGVYNSSNNTCQRSYCHSRGNSQAAQYATANYTAKWTDSNKGCNYCHGDRLQTFGGITAAMPNQAGQAHPKHARNTNGDNFRCSFCHANVVNSSGQIISYTNHVNKFKNISVISTYKTANEAYNPSGAKTCDNIKCHGGRTTPAWNLTATCTNCHYSTASPEDSFTWQNYSGTVARIYSTEWTKRGHGKTKVSGKYPFSNNTGAGKTCTICHTASVKHNQANYFRLRTTVTSGDSDKLCAACHGSGTELGKMGAGTFGKMTGIQTHSWANMSTNGYTGANNTGGKAGWNFPNQTVKCVDCHDPHGDKNNFMVHSYINMTGSDSLGRPVSPNNQDTVLMNFTAAKGGTLMTWSSFANSGNSGLCQRCHSAQASMGNFARDKYNSTHQQGNRCTNCHKHKKGFTPSGCDACHGYPPGYNGKAGPSGWKDSLTNKSSLHQPHAWNVRSRPGIPTNENNQQSNLVPAGQQGYYCNRCHGGTEGDSVSNGQDASHGSNINAGMKNMTMVWGDWSKGAFSGRTSVTDDTCRNVKCHTPRYYTRGWKKPVDCDDCHGYRRGTGASQRAFQLQTTGKHKIHINWTGTVNLPGSWKKNYNFACSNCHYNWQTNNNYSTHYNSFVNITANGPVNMRGGAFYARGRLFKGMTTGNEANTTCSNTYCHGNFADGNGLNQTINWKNGTVNCGSCHRSALVDETSMPERHPKHAATAKAGYGFACTRCHNRTTANVTTVMFTYSSHVNGRYDIYFDNQGGIDNSGGSYNTGSQFCSNIYCHSKGAKKAGPFNNRSGFPNFTAKWSLTPVGYKTGTGLRAKCNFCHGNKTWTGTTSAMPNYSTVRVKANSHLKHVINNRIACSTCHFGITANNTSIANRTAHANSFFNISIDPSFVSAAGKKYSTNWSVPKAGGTCMNNTCHGAGKPQWGSNVVCFDCHAGSEATNKPIKTAANGPNPVNFQEYTLYGHGRRTAATYPTSANSGAGKWNNSTKVGCYNTDNPFGCHLSTAGHMTKDTADPFRLGAYKTDTNGLCLSCHDGAGAGESALNPLHHTAAQLSSSRTWPFTPKCVDCHDPHGDSNISMIRGAVNTPRAGAFTSYTEGGGSGVFGNPTGIGEITSVTFNSRAGKAAGSYASNTPGTGICEICHSNKISPAVNWYNRQGDSNKTGTSHETRTGACAPTCHNHTAGFKGAGESTGGTQCVDCHDLYTRMRNDTNYHHVLSNSSAVYRSKTSFSATETNAKERRCLMCHVDHDAFNPLVKGINKRAANLRRDATLLTNKTGVATDFWPAKRLGKYLNTRPISGPSGSNGVCISCHKSVQNKNTTLQANNQGNRARSFSLALYTSSSHNFQIISGMNKFSDNSRFRANCSKCHSSYYMNKTDGAQGRNEFGLHDSKYRSVISPLGTSTSEVGPILKELCYNCHSRDVRSSYDFFSSVSMDTSAKLIKTAVEGKSYGHPVGANTAGHKPDEYLTAAYGWNVGANRHVECVDCHNTHGGNASITRDPGSAVATGSPNANKVAGAQLGVWGVQTSGSWPAAGAQPTYRTVAQVTYQYEVCAKCHSKFAWNTQQPPLVPSGGAGFDNLTGYLTDVMKEFNPKNYGYHPVVKVGKNQPPKTANTNWPPARSNLKYYDAFRGLTTFTQVSGLDWSFVPPYNRRSTMACSDCHKADSTGLAVASYGGKTVTAWGNWSSTRKSGVKDATLDTLDAYYATSKDTTLMTADLTGPGGFVKAQNLMIAYQARQNVGKNQLLKYKIHMPTGFGTATSINGTITAVNKSTEFLRYENSVSIYASMSTANCRTPTCLENNVKVDTYTAGAKFDVNQVAVEAIYPFTEALRGPHGSMQKWLLASANKAIWVDWDNNGAYTASIGEKPNNDTAFFAKEENVFCYNCHRRDVYALGGASAAPNIAPAHTDAWNGGKSSNNYSRFKHYWVGTSGGPGDPTDANLGNPFDIWCMMCHAGNGLGKIHGDWTRYKNYNPDGTVMLNMSGTGLNWRRPMAARLLNGAAAHLATLPSSSNYLFCYAAGNGTSVSACNQHGSGTAETYANAFNYTYTAY